MTNEEKWAVILQSLLGKLGLPNYNALLQAVEFPALPENRAAILNTCGVYPPEGVTRNQVIELLVTEWERRTGKPVEKPVPEKPKRKPLTLKRNSPDLTLMGSRLTRAKSETKTRRFVTTCFDPIVSKELVRWAVAENLEAMRNGWLNKSGFIQSVVNAIAHEINNNRRGAFGISMVFENPTEEIPWVESFREDAPKLVTHGEAQAKVLEYLEMYGGSEVQEAMGKKTNEEGEDTEE
jgi:hypothetical protein